MSDRARAARSYVEMLEARDWDSWGRLLSPDVVYEMPQSSEVVRGREAFVRFSTSYPGDWHLRPKVVIGDDERAVIWMEWYDGDQPGGHAQAFLEFDEEGLISRVTDFWPEPYDPPERADGPLESA